MTVTDPAPNIDLLDGAFYGGDPHPTYTWMRENAPVYFDAAHNVWGMASYAAVLGASESFHGRNIGLVLTGGNIDARSIAPILARHA